MFRLSSMFNGSFLQNHSHMKINLIIITIVNLKKFAQEIYPCLNQKMAQGFKRTGNAVSTKKSSGNATSSSTSNKIRKGSRFIAPKKTAAKAKIDLNHKLTAQLNRRAESALITRLGGNREGGLKVIRPDSRIVEELLAKKAKKEQGRNSSPVVGSASKKESENNSESTMNSLSKSALKHLNEQAEDFESSVEGEEE